jgi:hypothetical protein
MLCPNCRLECPDISSRCDCGYDFASRMMPTAANATDAAPVTGAKPVCGPPALRGVGGWLLLLVVGMTILNPLATLHNLLQGYDKIATYADRFPGLLSVAKADIVLSSVLMCLSIYAGVLLWGVRPAALKAAKVYFLAYLAYSVLVLIVVATADLPSQAAANMTASAFGQVFGAIIYVAIWWSYLNRSRRVKATYAVSLA